MGGIRVETRKKELDNIEKEQQQYIKSLEPRWSFDNSSFHTCEISDQESVYNPDKIIIVIQ